MNPITLLSLMLLAPAAAWATPDITIKAPADTLRYLTVTVEEYIDRDYDTDEAETILFTDGTVTIPGVDEPSYFISSLTPEGIFVLPGENIVLTAASDGKITATGSDIASAMLDYAAEGDSLQARLRTLDRNDGRFREVYTEWSTRADRRLPQYLDSPVGIFFLAQASMPGKTSHIDNLTPAATGSFQKAWIS